MAAASLRRWPRVAEQHQDLHYHFIADPTWSLESDGGTAAQGIDLNKITQPLQAAREKMVFQVLLLSTDVDLTSARQAIANHLRRSLGIQVAEAPALPVSAYQLAILIQGLWWDQGKLAKVWLDAPKGSRVAFVSDDQADWPPHRLVEIEANSSVMKFREELGAAHRFAKPEQLPELVGAVVTERLQAYAGSQALGLTAWERSYLEFRIPAWRSGRTALSKPHLFDAADAKELYQPELYTALHGTSVNFRSDGRGRPVRSKRERRAEKVLAASRARVVLAKWVTAPELLQIALVGAPGGGKTVFITRIAAAIGSACLGRPIDFEPDLDVEALRADGQLPIPVVIEATRIAQKDSTRITAVLEVIADELGAGGTLRPDAGEIESGLEAGRYFLMVDALDEVADSAKRSATLSLLKGCASVFPRAHLVLTTRSARYTGRLRFTPELETVEVAPLDEGQIQRLCSNWSTHRQRDNEYYQALMGAVLGLAEKMDTSRHDQSLTENPLMLTAICMVFEKYRSLPDDRGRLCELLVDDLCRSRTSEAPDRNWKLDESGKKDLLQRIALAMQEEGAQTWPFERAVEIAAPLVPQTEPSARERATRYVDWAADHTGMLRFQEAKNGQEQIRFWHRLFREYLSASRLAQEDSTADQKVMKLWQEKRLTDPFWEDVVRLLPRTLGTIEKARSVRQRLEALADQNPKERGRLLGLAAAGVIENRDLFPDIDSIALTASLAHTFEKEADSWSPIDRILLLECIGRLDPKEIGRAHV